MKHAVTKKQLLALKPLAFFIALSTSLTLIGCGDAKTTIVEKEPIPGVDNGHNHGAETAGRLFVLNTASIEAQVFDLDDKNLINTIPLDALPSAVYASGGYRFAALIERNADTVGFVDGGLWQEPHDDHFDQYTATPVLSNFSLNGSRPTHYDMFEGNVAVFFDGNAGAGSNAAVQVFDDQVIADAGTPAMVNFSVPMHGVAKPRGEHLLATVRRDDVESTSTNKILPDLVGVYHLHDGEYALEQTLDVVCPNLHGAAQNETHVVFGCSDGVLVATQGSGDAYSAQKLLNPDTMLDGARIGSLWGHEASGQFIGSASAGGVSQFFAVDPTRGDITLIDWQPVVNAKPVAREFAYEAEQFVILDDQGYLTLIEPHQDGDHTHWAYGARLAITDADVSAMPEGMKFSMTLAQNGHTVYVADPISQHIVVVDLDILAITSEIELDYAPAMITWLGIAESHDH
ncbi:hypothetical protein R50072_13770 [Simiduia litorea]|uniref:5-methyltetrahydrofolate--homocysteine methyltransferase n=1 Tax=Simiduia litorea TaxID=1435348 RepID=UPI0036F2C310